MELVISLHCGYFPLAVQKLLNFTLSHVSPRVISYAIAIFFQKVFAYFYVFKYFPYVFFSGALKVSGLALWFLIHFCAGCVYERKMHFHCL